MPSPASNPSPFLQANIFSRFFHGWITQLFTRSHKKGVLHLDDLYDILPHLESTKLTEQLEANWFDEIKRCPQKPSLFRATLRTIGWKPFLLGFLILLGETANIAQSLLLTFLMGFFEPCSTMSVWHAWSLAIATVLAALVYSFIDHTHIYYSVIYGQQLRIAYTGLIFRKVLRLSSHSMNSLSSGEITNLLSNDAGQIHLTLWFINYLWVAPIEIILVVIVFWHFVKYIAFIAIGYTLFLLLVQSVFGRLLVHFRVKILQVTDERVKIMSEIIQSVRIVKMYCWESAFAKKVCRIRQHEIIRCSWRLMLACIQLFFSQTYINMTFFMMYGTMWYFNLRFDTRFFAITTCILGNLRFAVVEFFGYAIRDLVHYETARKRIQVFLLLDECQRDNRLQPVEFEANSNTTEHELNEEQTVIDKTQIKTPRVVCDLKQARWEQNGTFCLRNITFDARPGDLICVIGPVGSGKSSLLQALSGEISSFDGKVQLNGSFCYVPQESWIFSSTVKTNILFGKEFNHKLFQRVVHAAALDSDFEQLPHGSNTLVGDQGVMLSGGQKARVNMARALYRDADIYLLDDPLSAVDVKVAKHLFEKSIKNYLKDKICILVTHQIQFLQDATTIIVLNNGEMAQMGTYNQLLSSSLAFARILENIYQQQQSVDPHHQQSIISSRHSENEADEDIKSIPTNVEIKQEGTVKWHVYVAYLRAGSGIILGVLLIVFMFFSQQSAAILCSWWLAKWSDDESHRHNTFNNCTITNNRNNNTIRDMGDREWNIRRNQRFHWLSVIVLVLFALTLIRIVVAEFVCLNAGRVLHNKMFKRLIRCPIAFFDLNPLGRILNRFTKDVANLDDYLPNNIFDFLVCLFQVLGTIALVGWLNPWSFIPAILAGAIMLFVRHCYAQCFRDLARLESITRSPIYSHLTATMQGLKVIRSYHAEQMCSAEFLSRVDNSTRVYYLYSVANRWAAIRFDWISISFIAFVTLLSMVARIVGHHFTIADVALTLSYSLNLVGLFQWTIRQSVAVETQMTSVERVLEYCSLDQEPPAQVSPDRRPPSNWPSQGQIVFNNVSMCHSTDEHSQLALHHISLIIEAGEKVGIVGRTGAGKSSLIQTLFRMGTLIDGRITIDNIDISTVGLDDVRQKISIIPQDPVLFTGTMRSNLDQFDDYSDAEIWIALEQVQLKALVAQSMPDGLHSMVSEGGSNLSVGQKQLVCLARAILKKSKILVIDEATANVDNATDELIQKAIREKFKECTVLTVAHRLRTVIDSDRILVLGNGEVLEFDTPNALLGNPQSHFTSLVEQTGRAESEHLRTLATSVASTLRLRRKPNDHNDNSPIESDETDPLLHSI